MIKCKSDSFVPTVATGVTKDEMILVSADGSAETRSISTSGDRVWRTASSDQSFARYAWTVK